MVMETLGSRGHQTQKTSFKTKMSHTNITLIWKEYSYKIATFSSGKLLSRRTQIPCLTIGTVTPIKTRQFAVDAHPVHVTGDRAASDALLVLQLRRTLHR